MKKFVMFLELTFEKITTHRVSLLINMVLYFDLFMETFKMYIIYNNTSSVFLESLQSFTRYHHTPTPVHSDRERRVSGIYY